MIIKMYSFFKYGFKKYPCLFELHTRIFMNEKPHDVWGLRQKEKEKVLGGIDETRLVVSW